MGLLSDEWSDYKARVNPEAILEDAFYAGAAATLLLLGAIGDEPLALESQGLVLERMIEELYAYMERTGK
jgi:hypothetical protein